MKKELEKYIYPQVLKVCKQRDIFLLKTVGNARETKGRADHTGVEKITGRRVEIETKRESDGTLSDDQIKYLTVMKNYNAFVSVIYNPEDIFKTFICKKCNKECFGNFCVYCGERNI